MSYPAYKQSDRQTEWQNERKHNSASLGEVIQELRYRKQIARQLRTPYVEDIHSNPVVLKSRSKVIHGHWKRNHWIDYTRLTRKSSYLTLNIIVTLKCGLEVHSRSLKMVTFDRPYMTFIVYRNATDRRTDRQAELVYQLYQYCASVCWRAIKTNGTVNDLQTWKHGGSIMSTSCAVKVKDDGKKIKECKVLKVFGKSHIVLDIGTVKLVFITQEVGYHHHHHHHHLRLISSCQNATCTV